MSQSVTPVTPVEAIIDSTMKRILASPNASTELCHIMARNGSDKGLGWHNYTRLYEPLLAGLVSTFQSRNLNIFEVGLGSRDPSIPSNMGPQFRTGASLFGWSEFLPEAEVWGADVDPKIRVEIGGRLRSFVVDQLDTPSIASMWADPLLCDEQFHFIVDDGLHDFPANANLLRNSWHKLRSGGIYIIEDILTTQISSFKDLAVEFLALDASVARFVPLPNNRNNHDNNMLVLLKA